MGPNLLLPVRLICRLRALGFVNSFVGRQYLVSSGLVTAVHHECAALHLVSVLWRPNNSSGLDRNDIHTLLEKTFWLTSKASRRNVTPDASATFRARNACNCDLDLSLKLSHLTFSPPFASYFVSNIPEPTSLLTASLLFQTQKIETCHAFAVSNDLGALN